MTTVEQSFVLKVPSRSHAELLRENRELRRLLCVTIAGSKAYMDDGEAQDSSVLPFIDFMRDPVDRIEAALRERQIRILTGLITTSEGGNNAPEQ